jgi:branched-chain amino acid transport system substrate-binding protein
MALKTFKGVLGNFSFDQNGDTTLKTLSGNVVKNGKWEFVSTLKAE